LSYQFQFVVCAHHDQSVDAGLDGARVLHGDIKHLDAVVDHGLTPEFPTMADNAPILVIVPSRTASSRRLLDRQRANETSSRISRLWVCKAYWST
jgi:hypothetical protein